MVPASCRASRPVDLAEVLATADQVYRTNPENITGPPEREEMNAQIVHEEPVSPDARRKIVGL